MPADIADWVQTQIREIQSRKASSVNEAIMLCESAIKALRKDNRAVEAELLISDFLGEQLLSAGESQRRMFVEDCITTFPPTLAKGLFDLAYLELQILTDVLKRDPKHTGVRMRVIKVAGNALYFQSKNARCRLWLLESYSFLHSACAPSPPRLPFHHPAPTPTQVNYPATSPCLTPWHSLTPLTRWT